MPLPLKILILCDTQDDAEASGVECRRHGFDVSIAWARDSAGLQQALAAGPFDLIVYDEHRCALDIVAAHRLIAKSGHDINLFILSDTSPTGTEKIISRLRTLDSPRRTRRTMLPAPHDGPPTPLTIGMALAAAFAVIIMASGAMSSKVPADAMQIAIDKDAESLNDFDTAAGK
ncbi:MAG: hypothetical protein ACTSV1_03790 [Alphaproteobacteria bacterium]